MTSDEGLLVIGFLLGGVFVFGIFELLVCFHDQSSPADDPEPGPANPPDGSNFARKVIEANAAKDRQDREEDARRKAIRPVFRDWLKREVESGSFDLKGRTVDEVVDSTSFASSTKWMDPRCTHDKGGVNKTGTTPRTEWRPVGQGPFGDENMSIVRKYDLGTGRHTESKLQFRDGKHVVSLHVARVGPPPLVGRIVCDYCPDVSLRGMALANKAALAELRLIEEANRDA